MTLKLPMEFRVLLKETLVSQLGCDKHNAELKTREFTTR